MRRAGQGKKLSDAARLLARGELTFGAGSEDADRTARDEALAAFGLVLEGEAAVAQDPPFHLWPEHVPALELWGAVQTQWRHGFAGPVGLDYAGVEAALRLQSTPRSERGERFAELRIMERAALEEWARRRAAGG